jgi:hypothetical protein
MNAKAKRKHLDEFSTAFRDIEFAEACIETLERLSGATPRRCIKQLKHYQQQALRRMDAAAEKLGAPYPGA